MNTSRILSVLTMATAVAIVSGCSKQEQPAASTTSTPASAPATAAAPAVPAAPATPAATPAPPSPTASEPAATSQAQGLLDKAKSLVDGGQYADASKLLQELSTMQLTPDQQKMLDDLKAAVQKNLAGSALGGMLNK
jgi:hypothetical protein